MPVNQPPINFSHHARDWTDRDGLPIRKIVLHATVSEDNNQSLTWLEGNPNGTSIHVLIRKSGQCYKMLDESKGANHVGYSRMVLEGVVYSQFSPHGCNEITLGIELVNLNNGKDPYPEAQLRAAAWWVQAWMDEFHLTRSDVICHRDIDQHGKTDPRGITPMDLFRYLDEPSAPAPDPTMTLLDDSTPVVGQAHGTADAAAAYLTRRGSDPSYTPNDHKVIAHTYWMQAVSVNIDPLMAFAQMVHETGGLTSWWSLRDGKSPSKGRRNPCGLGVTGEMSKVTRAPGPDWQFDDRSKIWKKGYGFANWTDAINAHLGHLLVYAVIPSMRNPAQKQMVMCDPRGPAVPVAYRGIATTWAHLNGRWAVPGTDYATKICAIANAILTQR